MYTGETIFSQIVKKEISAKIIFENNSALSFYDINPLTKIHVIVIPKKKYTDILDFSNNSSNKEKIEFYEAIDKTAHLLDLHKSGFRIISNCGNNAGQEIDHLHYHLLGGEKLGKIISK